LLAAAIEYLQARGISELNLRELAAAIGTSQRAGRRSGRRAS
jgi:AcrR family transcriptional regulator